MEGLYFMFFDEDIRCSCFIISIFSVDPSIYFMKSEWLRRKAKSGTCFAQVLSHPSPEHNVALGEVKFIMHTISNQVFDSVCDTAADISVTLSY